MLKVVGASWLQTRISTYILIAVVLLGICAILLGEFGRVENDGTYSARIVWNRKGGYRIDSLGQGNDLKNLPKGAAKAYYRPRIHESGWSYVEIETSSSYPDDVQAYAAGLLEGSLTWQLIHHHWYNTIVAACVQREEICNEIREKLEENASIVRRNAAILAPEDPFWHMVHLFYRQLDGLEAGWRFAVKRSRKTFNIPDVDFLWLAMASDLVNFGSPERPTSSRGFDVNAGGISLEKLMKENPDVEPLLKIVHHTAAPYTKMLRLLKKYTFGYHVSSMKNANRVPTRSIVSSSYPGALSSQDEYYLLYGKQERDLIVVTGTPLKISDIMENETEQEIIPNESESHIVMSSARIMSANWLATDGQSWSRLLGRRDGPENISRPTQWIVMRAIDSSVWLVEQHATMTHALDYTKTFNEKGNLFLDGASIFDKEEKEENSEIITIKPKEEENTVTEQPTENTKEIGENSHEETEKSLKKNQSIKNIFTNIHINAPGLKKTLGFRGEFAEVSIPFGVIDSKISLINSKGLDTFEATSGPVQYVHKEPFMWSKIFPLIPHIGHPDKFNFKSVEPLWVWLRKNSNNS